MENLEISAKTVEEAVQRALDQLGLTREEIDVTIVKEGRAGILGLGAEEAVVRITPRAVAPQLKPEPAKAGTAQDTLEQLLTLMGVTATVSAESNPMIEPEEEETSSILLNIAVDDPGVLIGRRGQTLAGLQYIVRLMVGHQTKDWTPIVIDVEGYKQRRFQSLQTLARQMADQVRLAQKPFTLEPMPPYERRIIHLTLVNHPDVTTQSIGEGEARKVVIMPKHQ